MRYLPVPILLAVMLLHAASPASAALISGQYEFREGVNLEVGDSTEDGLRLDSLRFQLPARTGRGVSRTSGPATVMVAISNTSRVSKKVGVAVALFDEQGRLLGVASGGSRLTGLKEERQKSYRLVFDDVNGQIHKAKTFQVSVESKP